MSVRAPLLEAKDSLAKASTPQPFSTSRTSNWIARLGGLPDYIQHVAHGILRSDPEGGESGAIQKAIGVVKNWASGVGKHVDATTRAAAAKAVAEWEKLKAANKGKAVLQHSWIEEADRYVASWADERKAIDGALLELATFEAVFSTDGMISLLGEGMLAEAASWSPTMKRTACAPQELERHEIYDGGQHVGTVSRRKGYSSDKGDQWSAFAVNGTKVTDYNTTSKPDALKALETHLAEAPARVITLPATGKFLVAQPSTYSGETTYRSFPNEATARHAAGLPQSPTVPEQNSRVQAVAESLRFDLLTVAGLDIPPLRRVQEARRRDPFDLVAEGFSAGELRDFRGRWRWGGEKIVIPHFEPAKGTPIPKPLASRTLPRDVSRPRASRAIPAQARYAGGVSRASARARAAHAGKPQIAVEDLASSVGRGKWSASAGRVAARLKAQKPLSSDELVKQVKAGKAIDTLSAHTLPNGNLTPERRQLHQRIVENLLQGKGVHEGSARAIFTAGGPASGKSGLLKTGTAKFERRVAGESPVQVPGDVVHVNPDVVREMLPEYQALKAAQREDAASLTHEEASALSKQVARIALARQHHVLIDTVGNSGKGKFAEKVRDALAAGHEVHVHYATVPVDQAIKRADKRGDETGRYVDHGYLREAHRAVSQRFGEVSQIKGIHLTVHDTSARPIRLLAEKRPGADNLSIRSRAGFEGFLRKGGE